MKYLLVSIAVGVVMCTILSLAAVVVAIPFWFLFGAYTLGMMAITITDLIAGDSE